MRECESCKYSKMSAHDSLCWLCWAGDMWEPEEATVESEQEGGDT